MRKLSRTWLYEPSEGECFVLAIEGCDYSGKSTMFRALKERYEHIPWVGFHKFPSKDIAERSLKEHIAFEEYLQDMADTVDRLKSEGKKVLIFDRYYLTTAIYEAVYNCPEEDPVIKTMDISDIALSEFDLPRAVVCTMTPGWSIISIRRDDSEKDRFEQNILNLYAVNSLYTSAFFKGVAVDGSRTEDEHCTSVMNALSSKIFNESSK